MVCSACRKMKGGAFLAKFKTRLPSGCFLIGIQALIDYAGRQESDFVEPIPQKSQTEPDKSLWDGKRKLKQDRARIPRKPDV